MAIVCNGATNVIVSASFGASRPSAYSMAVWWRADAAPSAAATSSVITIGNTLGFPNDLGDMYLMWSNTADVNRNRAMITPNGSDYLSTDTAGAGVANVWVHKVATYAAGRLRFYENGAQIGSDAAYTVISGAPADWRFACAVRSAGMVAMLAYWPIELSAADCAALGKGASPMRVRPQSLSYFVPGLRDANAVIGTTATATDLTYTDDNPRIFW